MDQSQVPSSDVTSPACSASFALVASGLAAGGPEAYYGTAISGFPNLYLLMGPNSLLGHNSVLIMAEFQATYILQLLHWMVNDKLKLLDVKPEVQASHNSWLQGLLEGSVWQSGCTSWYQLGHRGRNFTIWPKNTIAYWWHTRCVRKGDYKTVPVKNDA
jgi:cyclohexanone monooxygenase